MRLKYENSCFHTIHFGVHREGIPPSPGAPAAILCLPETILRLPEDIDQFSMRSVLKSKQSPRSRSTSITRPTISNSSSSVTSIGL